MVRICCRRVFGVECISTFSIFFENLNVNVTESDILVAESEAVFVCLSNNIGWFTKEEQFENLMFREPWGGGSISNIEP